MATRSAMDGGEFAHWHPAGRYGCSVQAVWPPQVLLFDIPSLPNHAQGEKSLPHSMDEQPAIEASPSDAPVAPTDCAYPAACRISRRSAHTGSSRGRAHRRPCRPPQHQYRTSSRFRPHRRRSCTTRSSTACPCRTSAADTGTCRRSPATTPPPTTAPAAESFDDLFPPTTPATPAVPTPDTPAAPEAPDGRRCRHRRPMRTIRLLPPCLLPLPAARSGGRR